jgi:hypothetical protein
MADNMGDPPSPRRGDGAGGEAVVIIDDEAAQPIRTSSFLNTFKKLVWRSVFPFVVLSTTGLLLFQIYTDYKEGYWDGAPQPLHWFFVAQVSMLAALILVMRHKGPKFQAICGLILICGLIVSTVIGLRWFIEVNNA